MVDRRIFAILAHKTSKKLAIRKFYIVRHGQTDYNKRGVVQGSGIDAPINALGQAQAQAFYQAYKDHPFDRLYTSALQRTHQSVAQFIADGLPHEALSQFNEIHWGNKEGQPFAPEAMNFYETTINAWASGNLDAKIDEGESAREMGERLQKGIDYVLSQPGDQILICMHGRAMRALLSLMLGKSLSEMDQFHHTNLCLYELSYEDGGFTLDKFNEQSHLEGLSIDD